MCKTSSFADVWVPLCQKHSKETLQKQSAPNFVKDCRQVICEFDEFKVRINSLPDTICRCSDFLNRKSMVNPLVARITISLNRLVICEFDEFKVRINSLPVTIRCRSDFLNREYGQPTISFE